MRVFGPVPYIALIAIEGGLIGALGALLWFARNAPWRWLLVPSAWVTLEATRAAVPFGGFAWAQLHHSQGTGSWLLAYAPWLGSWGTSMAIMVLGMGLAESIVNRAYWTRLILATVAVIGVGIGLSHVPAPLTTASGPPLTVGITQSGDVRHTFAAGISAVDPKNQRVIDILAAQWERAPLPRVDLLVWPENSFDNDPDAPNQARLKQDRDTLLARIGASTVFVGQNGHTADGELTNVIGVYQSGQLVTSIAKYKLVPFGEFFPYPKLLGWVPSAQLIGHMVPGHGPDSVAVAQTRVGAVICYESAFSSMISQAMAKNPGVLVVSTNNASFGSTAMKDQHVAISRFRAVEYGRPVVHASLSGPSAFITPDGRIHQRTQYLEGASLQQSFQPRTGFTPAAYLNPVLPWLAGAFSVCFLGLGVARRRLGHHRQAI